MHLHELEAPCLVLDRRRLGKNLAAMRQQEKTSQERKRLYSITKNHKGSIKVNSKVGEGSSFILTFPVC